MKSALQHSVVGNEVQSISMHQEIGEKLSEICDRLEYPCLTKELAQEIEAFWRDDSIQVYFIRMANNSSSLIYVSFNDIIDLNT